MLVRVPGSVPMRLLLILVVLPVHVQVLEVRMLLLITMLLRLLLLLNRTADGMHLPIVQTVAKNLLAKGMLCSTKRWGDALAKRLRANAAKCLPRRKHSPATNTLGTATKAKVTRRQCHQSQSQSRKR
jgi:hypothetical protein